MTNLFVKPQYLEMIVEIFNNYCPNSEVYAYGSRLTERAHDGSDLDLTIKNFPKDKSLFELRNIFSNSNIPFLVDINIYENLPQYFIDEIEKNNIKIYPENK